MVPSKFEQLKVGMKFKYYGFPDNYSFEIVDIRQDRVWVAYSNYLGHPFRLHNTNSLFDGTIEYIEENPCAEIAQSNHYHRQVQKITCNHHNKRFEQYFCAKKYWFCKDCGADLNKD